MFLPFTDSSLLIAQNSSFNSLKQQEFEKINF
jgi:hypothetical protein